MSTPSPSPSPVPTKKKTRIDFKGVPSGYSVELRAVLTDEDGNPLPGKEIEIYSIQPSDVRVEAHNARVHSESEYYETTVKTDENGVAIVNVEHCAAFIGDEEYGDSEAGGSCLLESIFEDPEQAARAKKTKLTLDFVYFDDSAQLTARLTDEDGNPIPGVEIWLDGSTKPTYFGWSIRVTTDDQGVATAIAPKYPWYHAEFDGDPERLYDWTHIWVTSLPKTALALNVEYSSSRSRAVAKLTDEHGKPLFNKPIEFYLIIDDIRCMYVDTSNTDEEGIAYEWYEFKAVFEGDDYYEPSEARAQFVALEPSPSPSPTPLPSPSPSLTPSPSPSPTKSACCSFWDIGCWFFRPDRTVCLFGKEINGMLLSIAFIAVLLLFAARRKQAWALI